MNRSILDMYMRQVEEDKLTENNDIVKNDNDEFGNIDMDDVTYDMYVTKVNELRNSANDMRNKFKAEYPSISDKSMDEQGLLNQYEGSVTIVKAICPKCGGVLHCECQPLYNPYSNEHIIKHKCACGFKANLEHVYPRYIIKDENNNIKELHEDYENRN